MCAKQCQIKLTKTTCVAPSRDSNSPRWNPALDTDYEDAVLPHQTLASSHRNYLRWMNVTMRRRANALHIGLIVWKRIRLVFDLKSHARVKFRASMADVWRNNLSFNSSALVAVRKLWFCCICFLCIWFFYIRCWLFQTAQCVLLFVTPFEYIIAFPSPTIHQIKTAQSKWRIYEHKSNPIIIGVAVLTRQCLCNTLNTDQFEDIRFEPIVNQLAECSGVSYHGTVRRRRLVRENQVYRATR